MITASNPLAFLALFLVVIVLLPLMAWFIIASQVRAASVVKEWAARDGYRIVRMQRRIFGGPFYGNSIYAAMWRLTVRDNRGQVRHLWAGSRGTLPTWLFCLPTEVDVKWDDGVPTDTCERNVG
jgi:hypothetical protein